MKGGMGCRTAKTGKKGKKGTKKTRGSGKKGGMHDGGMHHGGKKHAKRTMKRGKKSGKKLGKKSRRSRRHHRGGKSAAGASPAYQGFQNLLQATNTIEQLEAQQEALQQQKEAAAGKYHAGQKRLLKGAENIVMTPGSGTAVAMMQQAANTSEKTTAGFNAGAFLRS
jgi:hypothetical protein